MFFMSIIIILHDESFCHARYSVTTVCYNTLRTVKMKRFLVLTVVVLFAVLFVSMVQGRTWTDNKGHQITADYVELLQLDEPKVKLKTPAGKILLVPVRNLSGEDQDYILKVDDKDSENPKTNNNSDETGNDTIKNVSESIVASALQNLDINSLDAYKVLRQLQASNPTRIEPDYTLALLYVFQKKDYVQAQQLFIHCLNKKPDDVGSMINRGTLFIFQEKYPEAFKFYQKAYTLDNSNKTLFHNLNKVIYLLNAQKINMPETAQKKFIQLTADVSKNVDIEFNSKRGWMFEKCSEGISQESLKESWFKIEGYRLYEFPICITCKGKKVLEAFDKHSGKHQKRCTTCYGSGVEILKSDVAFQIDSEKWDREAQERKERREREEKARKEKWEREAQERERLAKEQEAKIQEAKKKEEQERKEEREKDLKEYEYALKNRSVDVKDTKICAAKIQRVFQVYLENAYSGDISVSENGNYLIIDVAVFNNSTTKKINFESWAGDRLNMGSKAILKDEYDNTYKRIVFGAGTLIAGNKPNDSIYPGKAIMDRLVFETPIVKAKKLTLILPGENIESDKDIQIEFDVSEIRMSKLRD